MLRLVQTLCSAVATCLLLAAVDGFVIHLRSEEELADAMESYSALVVHFYDSADESSRHLSANLRLAAKKLLPEIQCAEADSKAEDFQNVVDVLGLNDNQLQVGVSFRVQMPLLSCV